MHMLLSWISKKAYDFVPRDALFFKLLYNHVNGCMFRSLHNMYKAVESVVQCGVSRSDVIFQMVGLRQGCILSPCLFSLYIADFPSFLEARDGVCKCKGVKIGDRVVRVLMYADDLALVAESADDLQNMLDALHEYSSKWHFVVSDKTKVVIFNKQRSGTAGEALARSQRQQIQHTVFECGGAGVDVIDKFKYLGTIFHQDVVSTYAKVKGIIRCRIYTHATSFRVKQGKGCLAQWIRRCHIWKTQPDLTLQLFKTCVMPAMEYGVALWGVDSVHGAWKSVEQYWTSIARYALSAPAKAPIAALHGDLGWKPFYTRACYQVAAFWERVSMMSDDCVVRQAMNTQRKLVQQGQPCWLANVSVVLKSLSAIGLSLWTKWFEGDMFTVRDLRVKRMVQDVDCRGICRLNEVYVDAKQVVLEEINKKADNEWLTELARVEAKYGKGGNKLRTYATFKKVSELETYLLHIHDWRKRALLTRFRAGVAPLRIETGRYEASNDSRGLPVEQRICRCCSLDIESERHFLCHCPLYDEQRRVLLDACQFYNNNHYGTKKISMEDQDMWFIDVMACKDKEVCNAVATFVWESFKKRTEFLLSST